MTLVEFIGFVVSLFALVFLSIKRFREEMYRRRHPEEYAENEHKKELQLKNFLKSIHVDSEEEDNDDEDVDEDEKYTLAAHSQKKPENKQVAYTWGKKPLTEKPKLIDKDQLQKNMQEAKSKDEYYNIQYEDSLKQQQRHEEKMASAYEVNLELKYSRIHEMVQSLPSKKQLVIFREIFDKPLSLRWPDDF